MRSPLHSTPLAEVQTHWAMRSLKASIAGIFILWATAAPNIGAMAACHIPAIYNFGDSNSDTGGIAAAFFPMAVPCGERFFHRPAGRGCDGRIIIDFIAEHLGLPLLSPYLDTLGTGYRHGANFATGGATIRRQNESWFENGVSPFPLDIQVEHFNQFRDRATYMYGQDVAGKKSLHRSRLPRPKDFSKAIYTLDIGQNDLAAALRKRSNNDQILLTIPDTINQFALSVKSLYEKGARTFWVHNTGPFGCMPVAVVTVRDPEPGFFDEHGCNKVQNDLAREFNKHLKAKVIRLRTQLPKAAIIYVDMFSAKYRLIGNAKREGFEDAFKICCGHHENGMSVWCGNKATINGTVVFAGSCADPSKVISWDGVHYSQAANHWIATHILNGSFSDPPVSITQSCHHHHT